MNNLESELPDSTSHSQEYFENLENELKKEINALLFKLKSINIIVDSIEFDMGKQKVTKVDIINKNILTKPYKEWLEASKASTLKCPSVLNFFTDSSDGELALK